jgi:SHS2 domain-containing protein
MKNNGYQEIEHTADVALRVWGEDIYGLLRASAAGLYDLLNLKYTPDVPVSAKFYLMMSDSENLLIDFLNELLFISEDKAQYLVSFSFGAVDDRLEVFAEGFQILRINRQIKAATFHNMEVVKPEECLEATITFDV